MEDATTINHAGFCFITRKANYMSICRVNKTNNYTVMSNYHLRDKQLSLKAKGLLSVVLSLPDGWDYSINGLVSICKEGKTSVVNTIDELKENGYLKVDKLYPDKTESGLIEYVYTFYESRQCENQGIQNQDTENLALDNLCVENQPQLNTEKPNTERLSKDYNIPPNPKGEEPNGSEREDAEPTLEEEKRNPDHEYCKTVMDLYNAICKNLLSAKKVTVKRKRAVKKAKKDIEEFGGWEKYFSCVESRPFLNGKNKDGWKADFDWLLKPDKMLNIMEGKYNTQANSNYSYRKEPESMQEKYEALAREEERLKASGEYVESEIPF